MSICVNTSTKEFKDTARRLDIHPSELELIVHKFINMEGRENHFPSDREIMQELSNDSFTVSQTQQQLYEQRGYASPRRFSSLSHASSFVKELKSFFPNASTSIHRRFNGEYEVTMGKPEVGNPMKELQASLTQALRGRRAGDDDINRQLISLMRSTGITVLGRQEMAQFLKENSRVGVQEAVKGTQLDPEVTKEMEEIRQRALADGTFMKAPNGQPTKLNEKQWLQVRTKAFKEWFGDWINDPKNASKVLDKETGEPLVVYHGGAKNINIFRPSTEGSSNTGYGYYTDPQTGEKIPIDSNRGMFFSSSKSVAKSYTVVKAINYYSSLLSKVLSLLDTNSNGKGGFSKDVFKNIEGLYTTLDQLSEFSDRFDKFKNYLKGLQNTGKRLSEKEVNAFRDMLLEAHNEIRPLANRWNIALADIYEAVEDTKDFLSTYNSKDGIKRLIGGEIPDRIKREWETYKTKERNRDKQGLSPIANYETLSIFLGPSRSIILQYDGNNLYIEDNIYFKRTNVTEMSERQLQVIMDTLAAGVQRYREEGYKDNTILDRFDNITNLYGVFLNIRNPLSHDYEGSALDQGYKESQKFPLGYVIARQVNKAIKEGQDGVVYERVYDPYLADNYGVFNPSQIKSATDNVGTFSTENPDINAFIGKKARTKFEQQLHKYRPDMTEQEIQATLDFLHSLADTKENTVYIKAAIQWIVNKSIILPQDHEKVLQIFTEARKRRIDIMKYKTFGDLVTSDEMKPKEKNRTTFNPDEAKTFSNKRTVTTKGGREFTVYDVEDTAEGQREVCKALAAHYKVSPWCLSTFTASGEPTASAKMHWDIYNGISRKIAFENGVPVAFSSDTPENVDYNVDYTTRRSIDNVEIETFHYDIWLDERYDPDYYNRTKDRAHIVRASEVIVTYEALYGDDIGEEQVKKWIEEGVLLPEYITTDDGSTLYVLSKRGIEKSKKVEVQEKEDREYWWDMSDNAHLTLSDAIEVNGGTRSEINLGLAEGDIDAMMDDWTNLTQEDMGLGPEEPIDVDGSLTQEEENARIVREEQEYARITTEMRSTVFRDRELPPTAEEDIIRVFQNYQRHTLEGFNLGLRILQQKYTLSEGELEQLSRIINAKTLEETRAVIAEVQDLPFFLTPEGEMYGFVDKEGQIYLDETIITPEHPIHEYTHLWDRVVAQRNPELWKRGVELMKQTSLWKEVLESEQYGKKWQRMSSMTPEKLESLIASEVHARLTGERGLQMIDTITAEKGSENIVGKLKQWILDFWKALAQTFGKWNKDQLDSLTIEDFSKLTIRDFVDGVNLNQLAERQADSQQPPKTEDSVDTAYTNHSGGAVGSDSYWGEVGERYGVRSNHYYHGRPTAKGNIEITQAEFEEGKERVMKANESLHRGGNIDRYMDLLARNWMQVKNADSVFAVGHIVREGEPNSRGYRVTSTQVDGGTGWAVQMAIDAGKPVYVYDQVAKSWYTYTNGNWVEIGTPTLTRNFAGIGTREITQDGKNAIEQVYENTFNRTEESRTLPIVTNDKKVAAKTKTATKFIGHAEGVTESETTTLLQQMGSEANPGKYTSKDKVFVSIVDSKQGEERVRSEQQQKTVAESLKALRAGATLITSPKATINQADSNNGEKVLMNALIRNGATYSERIVEGQRIGVWHLEEKTTINQEGNPVSVSMDPKLEEYFQKQQILNAQLKALMEDSRLSSSELREIADQVVWWISDHITELINNKELRERDYKGVLKDVDISTMSRVDIVKAIGVQNLIEHAKLIFNPSNNQFNSLSQIAKAASMIKNWNALMILAQTTLLENEGFSIVENSEGMLEIEENIDPEVDNFNESQDEADLKETVGDLQEHWQIENRTIDVLTSASRLVKKALNECYLLDEKGQPQVTEWGIKKRLNAREATQSMLRWTRGSITLEDMISKLQEKAAEHTWLNPIIQRLMDTEGKESDFKSQFFSAFCKHFQSYSIVIRDNYGNYKSIPVNEHPALTEAMIQVTSQYQAGLHPLMSPSGINEKSYNQLVDTYNDLVNKQKILAREGFEEHKEKISRLLGYASNLLGYYVTPEIVSIGLDKEAFDSMFSALGYIVKSLSENKNIKSYDPFNYEGKGSIRGSVQRFLKPITEYLEDTAVSSVYDSGKMYQSYVTPSYLTKLMQKFNLEGTAYNSFLMEEFGQTEFLHVGNDVGDGWRTTFFRMLANDENARKLLAHKVQLNFDKKLYMKDMSDVDYIMSFLSEYWSEGSSEKESRVPAWFRVPMMSNKPSSEYIKFYSYRGANYRDSIVSQMYEIFLQELSRIQTVNMRGKDKTSEGYIKNLDDHGNRFHFLDFMNEYLTGTEKDSELGRLIASKLKGEEVDDTRLTSLTQEVIKNTMERRVESIINQWTALGVLEAAHSIQGIGANVRESLENFIWNDTLMAMNIMQLTITDPAFYANAEDLQKRLAQIHSPGIRGDVFATDYNGVRVSDGKVRTIYLTDFKGIVSNVIDNLTVLFDRKIANAKSEAERESYRMLKEHLVGENGQYRDINVTDGQAYNSITSYRKKAYIFGKWSPQAEELYQKIRKDTYDYADLQTAFQPMKPFVYSTPMVSSDAPGAPISKFKVPVQNKNSEYLLIMADALLQGESTGLPNALRAIYKVMEESHYDAEGNYKQDGIDTVQFGSAVKSGLGGEINIAQFIEGGTTEDIVRTLKEAVYSAPNVYNKNTVKEMAFEDYSLQQEVPEHFKNHFQLHGSQARYIITSELETVTPEGDPVTYMCEGKPMSASEFRQEYENTIAENIKESIQELITELKLDSFNPVERNIAISKILQREILSSPRYGVDLLLACSLDENGQFRIPLGDPVQSKRVEQLLNSVIKNRINKQKIKGGPVVQVSNFGTSKRLNIRFKDKSGNLLMTREEFAKSNKEGTYEDYINENQAGIAYFEVFAPIQSSELFKEFADSRGFIDAKTIEQISPELLKMIGYRIPTEGKFSITPMKIVGFLPREAGDAIMMPYDMTTINGSDFDVDKMYLMIKELDIATRFIPKQGETMSEAEEDYFKHNVTSLKRHLLKTVDFTPVITKTQRAQILERVEANITNRINAENRRHEEELSKIEDRFEQLESAEDEITYSDNEDKDAKIYNRRAKRVSKEKKLAIKKENDRHDKALRHLDKAKENAIQRELGRQKERNKKNTVDAFLRDGRYRSSENDTKLGRALRRAYIDYMYHVITPGTGRAYRNNKIFDMTYEVLTHETSVLEMFNPQGFDPEKKMGYMVAAYRNPANNYTWEQLQGMSIKELKALNERGKNLAFIDVHTQFYKQNAAAGSLIATFAVHRTAHAVLEGDVFFVDVSKACNVNEPFIIAGKEFSGMMKVDPRYNDFGELVGRGLGRLVGSAADAVKDPILNLMNINQNTSHILTTLIRLGMPFEKACLLLSGRVVSRVLATYYKESLLGNTSLNAVIRNAIKDIEESNNIASNSPLYKEELTEEELIRGIKYSSDEIELKTLLALSKIIKLSDAIKLSTFATRYNSISNAVGPLIVDNLISETKRTYLNSDSKLYEQHTMADGKVTYEQAFVDTILERHPILQQFARSYEEAQKVFRGMPANSVGFRTLLGYCRDTTLLKTFASNRKLMTALSDFYQTYLAIEGDIVDGSKLPYYIHEFPQEFINIKNKGDYADNFLIQSITYNTSKQGRLYLRVNSTGMEASVRQRLSAAWEDLHKRNPELSIKLFEYCFFRGGMGFSPLTFMNLIPIQVKEQIPHYLDTYRRLPETSPAHVLDLFIRHNTGEKSLVPTKKIGKSKPGEKAIPLYPDRQHKGFYVIPPSATEAINEMRKVRYFKFKTTETSQDEKGMTIKSERTVLLRFVEENNRGLVYKEISPLGNNNEYFELSTSPIEKSMEDFEIEVDTSRDSEVEKHTTSDTAEDIVIDNDSPVEMSQQELNETLLRVFQTSNMSTFAAAQRILNIKNMDAEAKARYREGYMRYIEKRLQELGITYNHDLVIKLLDEIC